MFTEKTYNAQYLPDNMKSFVPSIVCLFLLNLGFPTEAEGMLRLQLKGTVHFYLHYPLPPPPLPLPSPPVMEGNVWHRTAQGLLVSVFHYMRRGGECLYLISNGMSRWLPFLRLVLRTISIIIAFQVNGTFVQDTPVMLITAFQCTANFIDLSCTFSMLHLFPLCLSLISLFLQSFEG